MDVHKVVVVLLSVTCLMSSRVVAQEQAPLGWSPTAAAAYLDDRATTWFAFSSAEHGVGESKTACVCCHTIVPYAMARPKLSELLNQATPTPQETQLRQQTKLRTTNWSQLDSPPFELLYDFNSEKKKESFGTEAVLNALMLAYEDHYAQRQEPSEVTSRAFENLWQTQIRDGETKGFWAWLNFNLEPWESKNARYYGAALAAVAVGTAPGYYTPGTDADLDGQVADLRSYLKDRADEQNAYNRVWLVMASTKLEGLLSEVERNDIVDQIVSKRNADGGWSLSSLGNYTRSDQTPQVMTSDGYATGLIVYVLRNAGIAKDDERISPAISWLKANQKPSGAWPAYSLNKNRNLESFVGKFMSDAATAFSVMALTD